LHLRQICESSDSRGFLNDGRAELNGPRVTQNEKRRGLGLFASREVREVIFYVRGEGRKDAEKVVHLGEAGGTFLKCREGRWGNVRRENIGTEKGSRERGRRTYQAQGSHLIRKKIAAVGPCWETLIGKRGGEGQ